MATSQITSDPATQSSSTSAALLISLASLDHDAFELTLANIAQAFPGQDLIVATPDTNAASSANGIRISGYTPAAPSTGSWTLTAADFLNAHELVQKHHAQAVLHLGNEAQSLQPAALHSLAGALMEQNVDLVMPHYALPARAGLVNSAILYPVTRALFGARPRFPLAVDLGLSARAAERMATAAQRFTATNQPDALVWPVAEAAVAGYLITEVDAGTRTIPQPTSYDLNSLLALVAGSLFADVDAKAAFWQRARTAQPSQLTPTTPPTQDPSSVEEAHAMVDSFRLAFGNLQEIWSLVLPPQSLFGLKRLAAMTPTSFVLPESLWARVVYDFLLAFRLRTINRGHLLGALTPLYLAWVASHIIQTSKGSDPERHVEATAAAFEADKPYLVSRWRWPDRFNP